MDQLTHTVRRSNWINIIRQCQDRPAGTTAKQWIADDYSGDRHTGLAAPPHRNIQKRSLRKKSRAIL